MTNENQPQTPFSSASPSSFLDNQPSISKTPPSTPPPENISSASPQVVVAQAAKEHIPGWFYFIFIVTLLGFITMTVFLVMTLRQKQEVLKESLNTNVTVMPTNMVSVSYQPISITSIPEATKAANLGLPSLSETDQISDLEKDIDNTKISAVEEDIVSLNNDINASFQKQ